MPSPGGNPLISSRALCLARSQAGTELQLVFSHAVAVETFQSHNLSTKRKAGESSWDAGSKREHCNMLLTGTPAHGWHPKAGLHWSWCDMKMRGRPWESPSVCPFPGNGFRAGSRWVWWRPPQPARELLVTSPTPVGKWVGHGSSYGALGSRGSPRIGRLISRNFWQCSREHQSWLLKLVLSLNCYLWKNVFFVDQSRIKFL